MAYRLLQIQFRPKINGHYSKPSELSWQTVVISHSFVSWTSDVRDRILKLCKETGTRPSELFSWDDPEDWYGRLLFDLHFMDPSSVEVDDE